MKDRLGPRELDPLRIRQRTCHLLAMIRPILSPAATFAKIVEDHEAAFEQILAKARDLLLVRVPTTRFRHVAHWILEQRGIVERDDRTADDRARLDERMDDRDVAKNLREVLFGVGIIVRPTRALTSEMLEATVLDPCEREPPVVLRIPVIGRRLIIVLGTSEILIESVSPLRARRGDRDGAECQGPQSDTGETHGFFSPVCLTLASYNVSSSVCAFSYFGASSTPR